MTAPVAGSCVAARRVADAVERREHLGDEPTELLEQPVHGLGVGVRRTRGSFDSAGEVDEVLEREADVVAAARRSRPSRRSLLRPPASGHVTRARSDAAGAQLTRLGWIESLAA